MTPYPTLPHPTPPYPALLHTPYHACHAIPHAIPHAMPRHPPRYATLPFPQARALRAREFELERSLRALSRFSATDELDAFQR